MIECTCGSYAINDGWRDAEISRLTAALAEANAELLRAARDSGAAWQRACEREAALAEANATATSRGVNMNTCETCHWWTTAMRDGDWSLCVWHVGSRGSPAQQIRIVWGRDREALIKTRSDFGCVRWEARKEQQT